MLTAYPFFTGSRRLNIMPEARLESKSESNKKKLGRTLVHFLKRKNRRCTQTALMMFMYNFIAHLMVKRLLYISVNP
jgi:hypothetical protein